jgi:hypothetical protein
MPDRNGNPGVRDEQGVVANSGKRSLIEMLILTAYQYKFNQLQNKTHAFSY